MRLFGKNNITTFRRPLSKKLHQKRSYRVTTSLWDTSGKSSKTHQPSTHKHPSLKELRHQYSETLDRLKQIELAISNYRSDKGRTILVLGAGLSSSSAIKYFTDSAEKKGWFVRVGDANLSVAEKRVKGHPKAVPFQFDVHNSNQLEEEVKNAAIVVSLLPIAFHPVVARECVKHGTNMVTASYVSPEMKTLDQEAKKKGMILLNEIGVDPGIDHMGCMASVADIQRKGGDLYSVETFAGGLVAPESDNNPWNYKFTWNPRNVVLAGKGGVKFLHNGLHKYIPYHNVFKRYEMVNIPGSGKFEGYANRDSLKYRELYDLVNVPTFFRGTLRRPGFCDAWQIFVDLGLTDDSFIVEDSEHMTYRQFINSFLFYRKNDSVELKLAYTQGLSVDSPQMEKLRWLGIFEERPIGIKNATPADILQSLLEKKWKMKEDDKDMIVMLNRFYYNDPEGNRVEECTSTVMKGEDREYSAMAKTVGLPVAIATDLILDRKIRNTGVHVPIIPEIYEPVLAELEKFGITFNKTTKVFPAAQNDI